MEELSRDSRTIKPVILVAEDDPDDRFLLQEAFRPYEDACEILFVEDGEDLMDYLHCRGKYFKPAPPRPKLILLDLTMPKKDGWQSLVEIREREDLKDIPLVVLTTSKDEEDRVFCEKGGASGYVAKPNGFGEMCGAVRDIVNAWLPA